MDKPKWTPGDWVVKPIAIDFEKEPNALVGTFDVTFPVESISFPEMRANANLLEASKKMYEALKMAKEALQHDAPGDCWATGPLTGNPIADMVVCPGCVALNMIDNAFARAEGSK